MRRLVPGVSICTLAGVLVGGCTGLYGGAPDPEPAPGLRNLSPINFANDVPLNTDPVSVDLDGGSVAFAGGTAGTRGILPLYFSDAFAWNLNGGPAEISFQNLQIKAVRFYFAQQGDAGATVVALNTDGEAVGSAESFPAANLGDGNAVVEINAGESSITRLAFESPEGAIVSVDHLVLSVPE